MNTPLKRSVINKAIREAIAFFGKRKFPLPPYAYRTARDWKKHRSVCREIFDTRLGWDVTDFGSGDFNRIGRIIFTLRNGHAGKGSKYPKQYAHKVMMLREGQKSPVHFHKSKMEDIVNQGGGVTQIRVWGTTPQGAISKRPVTLSVDAIPRAVRPGGIIRLTPGQSVTLPPGTAHSYWAQKGAGPVLSVEVSSVNDDLHDNVWLGNYTRFPKISEDEPIHHPLVSDYGRIV